MNAFVRKLATLSALWSLCELLLPSGGQRRAARFAVSLLVMAALVSAIGEMLNAAGLETRAWQPVLAEGAAGDGPALAAVQSAANQAERYCEGLAKRAGYEAEGQVFLRRDGSLERVSLTLALPANDTPLMDADGLRDRLAQALKAEPERILIAWAEGDVPVGTQTRGANGP